MTFDFFGGRRLLLAGSRLGWIWTLALAAALILLLVLYREERRLVTRRAGSSCSPSAWRPRRHLGLPSSSQSPSAPWSKPCAGA